jgi:hypothetical protein
MTLSSSRIGSESTYAPPPVAPPPSPGDATRAAYDALPWYQKIPQAADDTARLVANGATLGFADKLAAAVPAAFGSGDYASNLAAERAASQAAADRAGWAGTADSLLGMAAPAGAIGKGVAAVGDAASSDRCIMSSTSESRRGAPARPGAARRLEHDGAGLRRQEAEQFILALDWARSWDHVCRARARRPATGPPSSSNHFNPGCSQNPYFDASADGLTQ